MTTANTIPAQGNEVKYRKAKLWQIILIAFNAFNGMAVYFLIGLASYSASIGYGIATLVVGGLLILYDFLCTKRKKTKPQEQKTDHWRQGRREGS